MLILPRFWDRLNQNVSIVDTFWFNKDTFLICTYWKMGRGEMPVNCLAATDCNTAAWAKSCWYWGAIDHALISVVLFFQRHLCFTQLQLIPPMTNPRKVITVNIIKTSLSSPSSIISSILYGCNTIQDHFLGQLYIGLTTLLARPSTDQYILLGQ